MEDITERRVPIKQESVEGFSNQLATKSREIQANVSTHVESVRHQLFSAVSFFFRKPEQPATGGKPEQSSDLVENKKLSPDVLAFAAASGNAGLKTLEEATKGVSVESSKEIETVLEALTGRPNGQVISCVLFDIYENQVQCTLIFSSP